MSWTPRFSFVVAGLLLATGLVLRLALRRHRWARRLGPYLFAAGGAIALYGIWQVALNVLIVHTGGAVHRARGVVHAEQLLHLPSEATLQRLALHAPWLVRLADAYYADVDYPAMGLCLLWLFARHRDSFARLLVTVVVTTGICSAIQAVPVAPPRLTPGFGFVDTAQRLGGAVYPPGLAGPGVLTTMPSVHVAWAAFIAVAVCSAGTSRWRWAITVHPVLTVLVVVVTGNHFWLDGLVALGILAATLAGQAGAGRLLRPAGHAVLRRWPVLRRAARDTAVSAPARVPEQAVKQS